MSNEDKITVKSLHCALNLIIKDYCTQCKELNPEKVKEYYLKTAERLTRTEELI